jgi:hypothetical protein
MTLHQQQQKQKQIQKQQTQFTIQTLDGETFQVSIPLTEAELGWEESHYALDYLKDAICSSTGNDPVSQQLICEEELTISTPLLPLVDTVITLIVKPSFTIKFVSNYWHAFEVEFRPQKFEVQPLCYLNTTENIQRNIRAIGQRLDYIKIATADLKVADVILRLDKLVIVETSNNRYNITDYTPTHVWLRFNKEHMIIVETT